MMKIKRERAFTLIELPVVIVLMSLGSVPGRCGDEPAGFLADKTDFIGEHFFLAIYHEPNRWLRVETSDDLKTWTGLVNIRSNREAFIYGDENASAIERRYYRFREGAPTVEEARARWLSLRPERYRFRMRRERVVKAEILTATVTVDGGSKTVSAIEVGGAGASPETEADAADFPDIDGLFDLMAETEALETLQTWVRYEGDLGHPLECQLDHRSVRAEIDRFRIEAFEILSSDGG